MTRWEYATLETSAAPSLSPNPERKVWLGGELRAFYGEVTDVLNQLGNDHWELVSTVVVPPFAAGHYSSIRYVLKRPI